MAASSRRSCTGGPFPPNPMQPRSPPQVMGPPRAPSSPAMQLLKRAPSTWLSRPALSTAPPAPSMEVICGRVRGVHEGQCSAGHRCQPAAPHASSLRAKQRSSSEVQLVPMAALAAARPPAPAGQQLAAHAAYRRLEREALPLAGAGELGLKRAGQRVHRAAARFQRQRLLQVQTCGAGQSSVCYLVGWGLKAGVQQRSWPGAQPLLPHSRHLLPQTCGPLPFHGGPGTS